METAKLTEPGKLLLGGEWRDAGERFTVASPFSQKVLAEVYSANAAEAEAAVSYAEAAAKEIRRLPRSELAKGLRKISADIGGRIEEFARSIANEAAKPISIARAEVGRAIANFSWAAGEAERFTGEVVPIDTQEAGKGKTAWTIQVPRGIIYGITPFNFPLNLVAHKVAPALASGNAIIIKPSPRTPLTALLLGEVFLESGLPKNALQVVPMDTKYIDTVLNDDRVSMVSFTGSAAVGWELKRKVGKKPVALELGGNAPVIVDESADVGSSLEKVAIGAFAYAGQSCISVQRVYIHEKIFGEWTEKFVEKARSLKKGAPLDESVLFSVMIDEQAAKRAETWVKEAVENGAKILCGGNREGSMLNATVLTDTDPEMRVVAEEVFAPVAVVEPFSEFEQAVDMANHSKYGLQAGVFTQDLTHANFASENLEYGGVTINDVPTFRVDNMPYGGVKDSGFGREGARYAMEEMSEIRLIVMNS